MSDPLAGLRPICGELDVFAAADDRAPSRHYDPVPHRVFVGADAAAVKQTTLPTDRTKVGQEHFVRFTEIREVDELVTDDRLAAGTAREIRPDEVEAVRA